MNFQQPRVQIIDTNGEVVPGAKIYFYETGTSTPLNTYSDYANTIANTNPVVCDASGRAGPIFLVETKIYKVIVKTSADVTIYTQDPVHPYILGNGITATSAITNNLSSSPVSFGAVGDGENDESSFVQAAINAATFTVDLLGLTYRCDSQIVLKSNLRITNGTLVFSNCSSPSLFSLTGSVSGSVHSLTSDLSPHSSNAGVNNPSGFITTGDYVILRSDENFSTNNTGNGEAVRVIDQSDAHDLITFTPPAMGTYKTSESASIKTMTMKENVVFENVTITSSSYVSGQIVFNFQVVKNLSFKNVLISGKFTTVFNFSTCIDALISGCTVQGSIAYTTGVRISGASRFVKVLDSSFDAVDTGVSLSGVSYVTRDSLIENCKFKGINRYGVFIGDSVEDCEVSSCEFMSMEYSGLSQYCFYILGNRAKIFKNRSIGFDTYFIYHAPTKSMNDVIFSADENYTIEVTENTVVGLYGTFFLIRDVSSAALILNPNISSNMVFNCSKFIDIEAETSGTNFFKIQSNDVYNATGKAIHLLLNGLFSKNISIDGNKLGAGTGVEIEIGSTALSNFSFVNNAITSSGDGFLFDRKGSSSPTMLNTHINENKIISSGFGIKVLIQNSNSTDNFNVLSNQISCNGLGFSVVVSGGSGYSRLFNVSNNSIKNASSSNSFEVIHSQDSSIIDGLVCNGNNIRSDSANGMILTRVSGGIMSNNYVRCGENAISINSGSYISVVGNFSTSDSTILLNSCTFSTIAENQIVGPIKIESQFTSFSDLTISENKASYVLLSEVGTSGFTNSNILIKSNKLTVGDTVSPISVIANKTATTIDNLEISDNTLKASSMPNIHLNISVNGPTIKNVLIANNKLTSTGNNYAAITLTVASSSTIQDVIITGNVFSSGSSSAYFARINGTSGASVNDIIAFNNLAFGTHSSVFFESNGSFRMKGLSSSSTDVSNLFLTKT